MQHSLIILLFSAAALGQVAVQIGSDCNPANGDEYGCDGGTNFLTCASNKWTLQNSCSTLCQDNPAFQSQCFKNSANGNRATSTSSTSIASSPTSTGSAANTIPGNSSSSLSPFVIAAIIIGGLAAIGLFIFIFVRFGKNGIIITAAGDKKEILETPVGILQKLYVVIKPYMQIQPDEVKLNVGDQVELYILYNDGWAKGFNITTGVSGLIPVTHLEIIPVDEDSKETKSVAGSFVGSIVSVHSNNEHAGRNSFHASVSSAHSSIQIPGQNR